MIALELHAADRAIAILGATAYIRTNFPRAQLEWGDSKTRPDPDDLDEVWREPGPGPQDQDRWFAVTAVAGRYGPAERSYPWGGRVLAGTRDYLRFAISGFRARGQDRVAGALEEQMYADRLVYLELTVVIDGQQATEVRARQYDISDATLAASVLAAAVSPNSDLIERLKQPLGPGAADRIASGYWTLPGWYEKALLGRVSWNCRDRSHAGLTRMFTDLLAIPDPVPGAENLADTAREARALAVTWLDGDHDAERFVRLYEDEDALAASVARHRGPG
jgi:hypothetical protein